MLVGITAELEMTLADGPVGRGVPSLDGRCDVLPDQPLPDLSTASAHAFVAVDRSDPSQQLYALLPDPQLPFRLSAIRHARNLGDVSVVKALQWSGVDWPQTARRETLLLIQRPAGKPLMESLDAEIRPWKTSDISTYLMKPMAALLTASADQRQAHRNIRPTNLFRVGKDDLVVAGEFYSAPAGFNQPSAFESIERAMCPPAGRGAGDITDDLYALGVTALFLALGRNPVAHLDDKTLLSMRTEMGSYAAMTTQTKPPGDLAPVIRSLMHDNVHDRWTVVDLLRWTDLGVANQARPMNPARSDRGFEFADGHFHTRVQLALAFSRNWDAARAVVLTDAVERWAERSFKDRHLAQQIIECRHSTDYGPRMISDDLLLARTIITLDPDGPLRFRELSVMPDGLGALSALVVADAGLAATFSEMVSSQLMEFWLEKQTRPKPLVKAGKEDGAKILTYLGKPGPGFGIERCVYELNQGMACQSPRFINANAVEIRELMQALDAGARKGEQQLDRHVAAFLGARYSGSIDAELGEFTSAGSGEAALLAQLKIFAAVQLKHGPRELPNLASLFSSHLEILLSPYRNVDLRKRLRLAAERIAPTGKLPELLGVIRNRSLQNEDKKGFDQAKRRFRDLERQVRAQEDSRARVSDRSLVVGRKAAAYVSVTIGITVVMMIAFSGVR